MTFGRKLHQNSTDVANILNFTGTVAANQMRVELLVMWVELLVTSLWCPKKVMVSLQATTVIAMHNPSAKVWSRDATDHEWCSTAFCANCTKCWKQQQQLQQQNPRGTFRWMGSVFTMNTVCVTYMKANHALISWPQYSPRGLKNIPHPVIVLVHKHWATIKPAMKNNHL